MPLFCDNEHVNKDHPSFERVSKGIKELQKKKTISIVPIWNLPDAELNPRVRQIRPDFMFPTKAIVVNPDTGMKETWRYADSFPEKKDNEIQWTQNAVKMDRGSMVLNPERNGEWAYFVMYLSPLLTDPDYKARFKIDDPVADATKEIDEGSLELTVKTLIRSRLKISPFYNDDEKLRTVCASWGVNVINKEPDVLRIELFEKVRQSQKDYSITHRGFQEFIDEVETNDLLMEYRANVNKGLQKGIIGWNESKRAYYWMDKKEFSELLFSIQPGDLARKENLLLDYFKSDFESYKSLQRFLNPKKENKYSHLTPQEVTEEAKSRGIKMFPRKSRAQLEAELIEQDNLVEA